MVVRSAAVAQAASIGSAVVLALQPGVMAWGDMPGWADRISSYSLLKPFNNALQNHFEPMGTGSGWDLEALALMAGWTVDRFCILGGVAVPGGTRVSFLCRHALAAGFYKPPGGGVAGGGAADSFPQRAQTRAVSRSVLSFCQRWPLKKQEYRTGREPIRTFRLRAPGRGVPSSGQVTGVRVSRGGT